MAIHSPLDFQYYFMNIFAGNANIFLFLCFIAIIALAARFRLNGYALGIISILFLALMSSWFSAWWIIALILAGFMLTPIIMRIWNRQ